MKKILTKTTTDPYYLKDGVRVEGIHAELSGDVSHLSGDVTGLSGYVSGIYGDVDACEITNEERERGVDIKDLIQ